MTPHDEGFPLWHLRSAPCPGESCHRGNPHHAAPRPVRV